MNKITNNRAAAKQNFVSTRNACKLCAPLGASLVFRGIEGCVPLVHGSQGCATYIRRYIISHFREPMDIASSNFSESAAIFGGGENFKTALDNVIRQYAPAVIGVASTCLSETIGDDISRYVSEYRAEKKEGFPVIVHASTPSYSGTHMEGFRAAIRATVEQLAVRTEPKGDVRVNIISSLLSAEDLRYIRELTGEAGILCTLLPDYSETLDGESWEEYRKLPEGGTRIEDIKAMGNAVGTIELGAGITDQRSAAHYLEQRFGVSAARIGLPIGVDASDAFVQALESYSGRKISERHAKERGRLVDAYVDAHKYLYGARALVYGEADLAAGLASFLSEIGVKVVMCATGARGQDLPPAVRERVESDGAIFEEDADFATMLERARELSPDFVIGSSKGNYLARHLGVPVIRCGFPVHDRFGGQRLMHIGYRGTQQLFDRVVNTILEQRQTSNHIGYSYM